jgi:hypothetical protein
MADAMQTLEQVGPVLVAVYFLICFLISATANYTLQTISDKTNAAPSWTCWVPLVQIYPFVKAGGGSLWVLLAWFGAALGGGIMAGLASPGLGMLVAIVAACGAGVYMLMLMWRLAENRELSGWVGILCVIPPLGLLLYPYIAFHDGFVRPSFAGLALTLLLALSGAASLNGELAGMRASMQKNAAEVDPMTPEQRAQLEAVVKQFAGSFQTTKATNGEAQDSPGLLDRLRALAKGNTGPGYPDDIEIPDEVECEADTERVGAAPPNGRRKEAGVYVEGERQGVWTRFWELGGRKAQVNFERDREHGILVNWDPLGQKEREIRYLHGEPHPL